MNIETHANFSDHYVAAVVKAPSRALVRVPVEDIQVLMCVDLDAEVQKYMTTGLCTVGTAQFVGKGNQGIGREAREQAAIVGAALVLFSLVPCKLRAIRKPAEGRIDMNAVLADPPASLSPRGYSVLTSVFLAREAK
jgi:hypothetical protein